MSNLFECLTYFKVTSIYMPSLEYHFLGWLSLLSYFKQLSSIKMPKLLESYGEFSHWLRVGNPALFLHKRAKKKTMSKYEWKSYMKSYLS